MEIPRRSRRPRLLLVVAFIEVAAKLPDDRTRSNYAQLSLASQHRYWLIASAGRACEASPGATSRSIGQAHFAPLPG